MIVQPSLIEIFDRDLQLLEREIAAYDRETDLWRRADGISNSAGNLCLHLCGNLQHFIGAALGNTGYVRQRDLEFSTQNTPRTELLAHLQDTRNTVRQTLTAMLPADFDKTYPLPFPKPTETVNTTFMLLHLLAHLSYHLGQINYHRRLLAINND